MKTEDEGHNRSVQKQARARDRSERAEEKEGDKSDKEEGRHGETRGESNILTSVSWY
jgi:hypothetical protein